MNDGNSIWTHERASKLVPVHGARLQAPALSEVGESRIIFVKARPFVSGINKVLFWLAAGLAALALTSSIGLLTIATKVGFARGIPPAAVSALPLLTVGLSFLLVQPMIRPRRAELLKNLLIVAAFLLWGVVQLIERNPLSKTLGDVVIALYVVELAWTILARLHSARKQAA